MAAAKGFIFATARDWGKKQPQAKAITGGFIERQRK